MRALDTTQRAVILSGVEGPLHFRQAA